MRVLSQRMNKNHRLMLLGAAVGTGLICLQANMVNAAAINVVMTNASMAATTGNSTNSGINPVTYTPSQVTISGGAADTTDTGTTWNGLQSVNTAPTTNTSGATVNVLYEQNLPLVDSSGAITAATLNVSAILPNNKADFIHTGVRTTAGTDTLLPNPAGLMGNAFVANGTGEGMIFTVDGLTPGNYNVYVYGGGIGTSTGQGANFTLDAGNGGAAAATNVTAGSEFVSVFDSTNNPATEKGLSWNLLSATVGANGVLTFTATVSAGGTKPAVNGFQIDAAGTVAAPEPASLGVLAVGGLALLARRRKA